MAWLLVLSHLSGKAPDGFGTDGQVVHQTRLPGFTGPIPPPVSIRVLSIRFVLQPESYHKLVAGVKMDAG